MIEWFRHDTDARNDIKIRKLLRDNDRASLGAYWMCIEIIYQNEGYIEESSLTDELSFYDMDEFIPALISLDLIERTDDGKLTSKRVLDEIETNRRMAQVRSEKARKAINTRWHKNDSESNGIQSNTDEYERIRNHTNHSTQHNTTQHKDYKLSSPLQVESINLPSNITDSCTEFVGGQQADAPAKKEDETDLFGEKVDLRQDIERIPYDLIGQYWNTKAKGRLPQIKEITEERRSLIRQRWNEHHNDVYVAIDKITASDDMVAWGKCGFDWTFQRKNMVKILEGNYDNKSGTKRKDYSDISTEDLKGDFRWK